MASPADDPADPAVVAQAVALGRDPQRIFEFVRDQIGLELYTTSLRGARGVLYSRAGNSLDRASLLVALLRASGVNARYVQGALNSQYNNAVIESMFAQRYQVLGCPPGTGLSFPTNSYVANYLNPHFWVEFGTGNAAMDPTLRAAVMGQVYGTVSSRFTDIPDALRQKVTVRLMVESYNAAGALFGLGVGTAKVLEQTFETAEIYGKPISIGHLVSTRSLAGLTASANIYTYSPYLIVGDPRQDARQHEAIRGTDFQESLTNFPLSSIILTGLFIEVDAEDRNEQKQTYRKTLVDRLGVAARRNGGRITVQPGNLQATISEQDVTTINILGGLQGTAVFPLLEARLRVLQTEAALIQPRLDPLPAQGPLNPAQLTTMQDGLKLSRALSTVVNELNAAGWARAADRFLTQLQTGYLVRAWYNRPRIIVATSKRTQGRLTFGLDLLKRDVLTVGEAYQRNAATAAFELMRGSVESALEGEVLATSSGLPAVSAFHVLNGATDGLTVIGAPNVSALGTLNISEAARALITDATVRGRIVLTPRQPVVVNGLPRMAWLEYDPTTGETISTFEDGSHGAIFEFISSEIINQNYNAKIAEFCGQVNGIGIAGLVFASGILNGVASGAEMAREVRKGKDAVGQTFGNLTIGGGTAVGDALKVSVFSAFKIFTDKNAGFPPLPEGANLLLSLTKGLYTGLKFAKEWLTKNINGDPEVY